MKKILDALEYKAIRFLTSNLNIQVTNKKHKSINNKKLSLKKYSAKILTSGLFKSSLLMSYDEGVLSEMTERFINCKKLNPTEKEKIKQSACCEFLNIIVGNALDCPNTKDLISITPPMVVNDEELVFNNTLLTSTIQTKYGEILICIEQSSLE